MYISIFKIVTYLLYIYLYHILFDDSIQADNSFHIDDSIQLDDSIRRFRLIRREGSRASAPKPRNPGALSSN